MDEFRTELKRAAFREYADKWQAWRSIGWADCDPDSPEPRWLFGACVTLRRLPLVGSWLVQHELFHGAQDLQWERKLFHRPLPLPPLTRRQVLWVETEAFLFGTPVFGAFLILLTLFLVWTAWLILMELMTIYDILFAAWMG